MPIKTCLQCGSEFNARTNGVTCSKICARRRHNEQDNKSRRIRYASDEKYRLERCATSVAYRMKMSDDPAFVEKERIRSVTRMRKKRDDPNFRALDTLRTAEYLRERRLVDPEFRERDNARRANEYRSTRTENARLMLTVFDNSAFGETDSPCFVYMIYGERDALLYIGITDDPKYRFYQHSHDKPWFEKINLIYLATFRSKTEAMAAEAFLIKSLRPIHNVQHNNGHFDSVDETILNDLLVRFMPIDLLSAA